MYPQYTKTLEPFYMVARLGGGSPSQAHASYEKAKEEAERLATKHPGNTFYILIASGMVTSKVVVEYNHFNHK
jgi:hypothetical protein